MPVSISNARRPTRRLTIVDRPRLYRALEGWPARRAIVIQAPAGYGKTTLARRWVAAAGMAERTGWLSLTEQDADPRVFLASLAAALEQLQPGITAGLEAALGTQTTHPASVLRRLTQVLEATRDAAEPDQARLIVLDDLHRAASPEVGQLVRLWLESGPDWMTLLILTRHLDDIPLARFVALGEARILDKTDLRFTAEEVEQYLLAQGFGDVSDADLARLTQLSEGWITALQLAVLAEQGSGKLPEVSDPASFDRHWIAAYFADEILNNLPPSLRRFLLETSILERFNLALCQAVTDADAAGACLAAAADRDLFLVPLGQEWYRYHHLFQEHLQQALRRESSPGAVAALHRRAARWWERAGDDYNVIHHLLAANLDDEAAAFLEQRMWQTLARTPERTLRLMRLLPEPQWQKRPNLLIDRCLIALYVDDERFGERVREAESALLSSGELLAANPRLMGRWLVAQSALRLTARDYPGAAELAGAARALAPEMDPYAAGTLHFLEAWLAYHVGEVSQTDRLAERAIALYERAPFPVGALAVRRQQARWSHLRGDSAQANRLYEWLDRKVTIHNDTAYEYVTMLIVAADHHYWRNDLTRAARLAEQAAENAWQLANDELIYCTEVQRQLYQAAGPPEPLALQPFEAYRERFPSAFWSRFIIELDIQRLVATGRPEQAWQLAQELRLDPEDPSTPRAYTVIPFLHAAIAAGSELPFVGRLVDEALAHFAAAGQRFYQLRLLALKAWHCLKLGAFDQAGRAALEAYELAEATGYQRVILDVPAVLELLPAENVALLTGAQHSLTKREVDVLSLLTKGCSYQEIADRRNVSINTVRTHVRNVYKKLSVAERDQAVAVARRLGLVTG